MQLLKIHYRRFNDMEKCLHLLFKIYCIKKLFAKQYVKCENYTHTHYTHIYMFIVIIRTVPKYFHALLQGI